MTMLNPKNAKVPALIMPGSVKAPVKSASAALQTLPQTLTKTAGLPDAAIGALVGMLFGRIQSSVPGLASVLADPTARDAAIGATAVLAVNGMKNTGEEGPVFAENPGRPDPVRMLM